MIAIGTLILAMSSHAAAFPPDQDDNEEQGVFVPATGTVGADVEPAGQSAEGISVYWRNRFAAKAAANDLTPETRLTSIVSCAFLQSLLEQLQATVITVSPNAEMREFRVDSSEVVSPQDAAILSSTDVGPVVTRCIASDLHTGEVFEYFQSGGVIDGRLLTAHGLPPYCASGETYRAAFFRSIAGDRWLPNASSVVWTTPLVDGFCSEVGQ